ncbi:MAG: hypothetical protein V2J14_11790 [Erythrobacter sp.]|jgi:hypothetical protein|nr:hypothetical protein [Erythrobacter sp.]
MASMILMVAFVALLGWGCTAIIAAHYGLALAIPYAGLALLTNYAGPPLLVLSAGFSWLRARTWRRMSAERAALPGGAATRLARGAHQLEKPDDGPATLERLCGMLLSLGFCAIPYWLGASSPELWLLSGFALWLFRRRLL